MIKSVFSSLVGRQDKVARSITTLMRAPFVTGMRVAEETLATGWHDEVSRGFFERRLEHAIAELDRALTLSPKEGQHVSEKYYIRTVQGLCYSQIRGAHVFAQKSLADTLTTLSTELRAKRQELSSLRTTSDSLLDKARREDSLALRKLNPSGQATVESSRHSEAAKRYLKEAQPIRRREATLSLEVESLNAVLASISGPRQLKDSHN